MSRFLTAYFGAGLTMIVLDAIWLTSMLPFYRQNMGHLMATEMKFGAAAAFYLIYVVGIVMLAIIPALNAGGGWRDAAISGAILGLVAYGTYDLTNQATLSNWPLALTLTDIAWGTILTAAAAAAGALAAQTFASS